LGAVDALLGGLDAAGAVLVVAPVGLDLLCGEGVGVVELCGDRVDALLVVARPRARAAAFPSAWGSSSSGPTLWVGGRAVRRARGTMDLHARSATEFDFTFHLSK